MLTIIISLLRRQEMTLEDNMKTLRTIININYVYEFSSHVTTSQRTGGLRYTLIGQSVSALQELIVVFFFRRYIFCEKMV